MTIPKRSLSLTPQGLQGNINAVPKQYDVTITFNFAPSTNDVLLVDYMK